MLPEVKQFVAALEAAAEKKAAAVAALNTKCDYTVQSQDCPHCIAMKPSQAEYGRAADAAWNELAASTDPLVRWIAENCREYAEEAQIVLEALPASMDELDGIARGEGWCDVWRRFVRKAREADVLPECTPEASER